MSIPPSAGGRSWQFPEALHEREGLVLNSPSRPGWPDGLQQLAVEHKAIVTEVVVGWPRPFARCYRLGDPKWVDGAVIWTASQGGKEAVVPFGAMWLGLAIDLAVYVALFVVAFEGGLWVRGLRRRIERKMRSMQLLVGWDKLRHLPGMRDGKSAQASRRALKSRDRFAAEQVSSTITGTSYGCEYPSISIAAR